MTRCSLYLIERYHADLLFLPCFIESTRLGNLFISSFMPVLQSMGLRVLAHILHLTLCCHRLYTELRLKYLSESYESLMAMRNSANPPTIV